MRKYDLSFASLAIAAALLATVAACERGSGEMQWARAALERNPQLEIVASDEAAGTFTVRDRGSGQLQVVRFDEVAAVPAAQPAAGQAQAANAAVPAAAASTSDAAQASAIDRSATASAAEGMPEAGSGMTETSSFAEQGNEASGAQAAVSGGASTAATSADPPGRVIAQGPGYTIKAAGGASPAAATQSQSASAAGTATEQRREPLVCQGQRFMHIDGRNISFSGDGVRAEDGCELFITNSQITANGVGVTARGARVHIANSTVAGESAALQASESAQVYTRAARFRGMIRRLDDAVIQEGDAPASN